MFVACKIRKSGDLVSAKAERLIPALQPSRRAFFLR